MFDPLIEPDDQFTIDLHIRFLRQDWLFHRIDERQGKIRLHPLIQCYKTGNNLADIA